jgi:hypothetical protein
MKKLYALLFICSFGFSQVTLPHYDGMNYTVGDFLQTQPNWTSINTGDDLVIASGSLSFSGLESSIGNKVTFQGAGIDAYKEFTPQTTGTVYFSFLLNVSSTVGQTSANGGYQFGLIQAGSTSIFGATIWTKRIDDNSYNLGINPRTTAANTVFVSDPLNVGQTYLVVGSYEIVDGTGNDIVNLWLNPVPGQAQPTPNVTATNTGGTDFNTSGVGRFLVRQGSATDTPFIEFDELRIGTTWASVTPEATARIAENNIPGLKMYPNPTKNGQALFITSDSSVEKNVAIYNVLGRKVLETTTQQSTINTNALTTGVYMVKITEEGKTATRKLVIQ